MEARVNTRRQAREEGTGATVGGVAVIVVVAAGTPLVVMVAGASLVVVAVEATAVVMAETQAMVEALERRLRASKPSSKRK